VSRPDIASPVRALSLDLDDTLLDGSRFEASTVRACDKIALELPGGDARQLYAVNADIWREYWPQVIDGWMLGVLDGAAVTLEAWRRTLRECGCYDDALARRAAQIHLRLGRRSYRLFEDARELLAAARRIELPLALVTNGASDTQRDKLRALGIEQAFDVIAISAEVGFAKPDARVFQFVLCELALEPANVWHVGDNLATDVAGAKAASLRAVWINRDNRTRAESQPEPDLEIRSLRDLIGELPK
jgi:HAD superfamily hydrolase (TIGR01549 family)